MNAPFKSSEFNTQSTAFLGVISDGRGMFHHKCYDRAVNTHLFVLFLEQLRKKHGRGRFNLYMDNLRVHTSKLSMEKMEELNIQPMFAPIYEPDYNPIELVFS
jgi:transposase